MPWLVNVIVTGIGYNGISSRDSTGELLLLMYSRLQQLAFPERRLFGLLGVGTLYVICTVRKPPLFATWID